MIYTVTLNPAIDRTILLDEINQKDVSRVRQTIRQAAGKGINVSNALQKMNQKSIVATILAGDNGEFIRRELQENGFECLIVYANGNTRENIKVVPDKGQLLELNESGPVCTMDQVVQLQTKIDSLIQPQDVIVFTGSIPKGLPATTYYDLINHYNTLGVTTVLDASGENLQQGIKASPTIIKPNVFELERLFDTSLPTLDDIIKAGEKIVASGVKEVLITMGKDGSVLVTNDQTRYVPPVSVNTVNTVGAGDSFLAGYVYGTNKQLPYNERLQYATSVAISSVQYEGTGPKDGNDINKYVKTIKIETK